MGKAGWLVVTITAMASTALAQPAPSATPGFVTMDRFDETSRAGGEISYLFPHNAGDQSVTAMRFEGHGQYVDPASGFGGYAQLPLSYVSGGGQSETGVGDLEVGGIYCPRLTSPNVALVIHAGLTLPTGSTDFNSLEANLVGSLARLDDFYDIVPHGLSLRIGVSPIVRSGNVFARLDLGFDSNISGYEGTNVESVLRVNVGGGVDLGTVALMAELVNIHANTNSNPGSTGDQWLNEAAVSARMRSGNVQPYLALVLPIDHDSHQILDAAITAGIEASIR
jgi:hypothetical protein